jgi:gliding motility-associated-like protein
MRLKRAATLFLVLCSAYFLNAQPTTLFLQPDETCGKDAILHGLSSQSNVNYGNDPQLPADAWTFSGESGVLRGIFEFDLSSIPQGCTITNAKLFLYAWTQTNGLGQHSSLSGPNTVLIQRVTSPWNEGTVTWNTQPSTTVQSQVTLPATTIPTLDYLNINVTALVQDMVNDPQNSHGFMLKLQTEQYYRIMNFCSSDHPDPTKHPSLNITCGCSFSAVACGDTLNGTVVPGTPAPPELVIDIPNVFTPNNDGANDIFLISSTEYSGMHLMIYDRWGRLLHEAAGDVTGWDARIDRSGNSAADGTYYYVLTATHIPSGAELKRSGFFELIR